MNDQFSFIQARDRRVRSRFFVRGTLPQALYPALGIRPSDRKGGNDAIDNIFDFVHIPSAGANPGVMPKIFFYHVPRLRATFVLNILQAHRQGQI